MRSFSRQRFCTTPFHCQRRATRRSQQLNPKRPCEKDVIVVFKKNNTNCWVTFFVQSDRFVALGESIEFNLPVDAAENTTPSPRPGRGGGGGGGGDLAC